MTLHGRMAAAAVVALLALPSCTEERGRDAVGLRADFTARGAVISPAGGADWAFRATPWGLGCDGTLDALGEAAPETRGDRTVYARPRIDEWYVRGPRGVEQGFTLAAPPACRREGKRGVVIALGGGLPVDVDEGGRGATLRDAAGTEVLRYADLHVVDAAGRELPASIEARGEGLAIRFDDMGAAYPVVVDPVMSVDEQKILEPDAGENEGVFAGAFAASVAISGDTLLVGAPGQGPSELGAAFVFVRSGTQWSFQQVLIAGDGMLGAAFGSAVALQGDTAVIGARVQGTAYVFTRTGTTWEQTQELAPCAAQSGYGSFGQAVALDGDTLVVGQGSGACVYVVSGGEWTLQGVLAHAGAGPGFGLSVALSGDTALVGAPAEAPGPGSAAAYVFVRAGGAWTLQEQLPATSAKPVDTFGESVAVEGDTAVVASYQEASLFTRSGSTWTGLSHLVPTLPITEFFTVSLSGGRLVIGGNADPGTGGIAVFAPKGAGLAFQQALLLGTATDMEPVSVAMDGPTIAAGLPIPLDAFVITLLSSDGAACASPLTCTSGFCVDGVCCGVPTCPGEGPCTAAEHCQPGTGKCSFTPIHEGMPCPTDVCMSDATCQAGTCTGFAKLCPPANDCHEFGTCDPSSGQCSTPEKPDGTPCAGGKTCLDGFCGGPPPPSPSPSPSQSGKGCACDAGGGAPAGGVLVSGIALAMLRRRRRLTERRGS